MQHLAVKYFKLSHFGWYFDKQLNFRTSPSLSIKQGLSYYANVLFTDYNKASAFMLCKNRVENKSVDAYKKHSLKNLTRMDKIKLVVCLNKPTHLALS